MAVTLTLALPCTSLPILPPHRPILLHSFTINSPSPIYNTLQGKGKEAKTPSAHETHNKDNEITSSIELGNAGERRVSNEKVINTDPTSS